MNKINSTINGANYALYSYCRTNGKGVAVMCNWHYHLNVIQKTF